MKPGCENRGNAFPAEKSGRKARLLFVDDDEKLRELLSLYLDANGFEVLTAANVAQARACLDRERFQLAILDVNLNGESGFDLLDYAKRKQPQLPVLMFTGLDVDEELTRKTLAGRAEGIVRKTGSLDGILAHAQWHAAPVD